MGSGLVTLKMLSDPNAVQLAIDEFRRLGRTQFLQKYRFGKSRAYMIRDDGGSLYDSKAIVGAAYGYQYPDRGSLTSDDLSDGEEIVECKLQELGYEVVRIGQDWSRDEIEAAVADYLEMLELEARGEPFNKAQRNVLLRRRLTSRSKGSVELKHQNISAVLHELGLPFVRGYKPRSNVQELLRSVVRNQLEVNRQRLVRIVDTLEEVKNPSTRGYVGVLVNPPMPEPTIPTERRPRMPRKFDYASRDELNRDLGRSGESWVIGYESDRLDSEGYTDLVGQISWVSEDLGDGAGYDIASFSRPAEPRFIEVKTTNGGALTPFIVSANEVAFSQEAGDAFFLYRVFGYKTNPQLYMLRGDLEQSVSLTPIDYRARLRSLI